MKRGNTALKRAVSVASVAAMAIAGAVLAAPAASAAAAAAPADIRATPIAAAKYMTSDGVKVASVIDANRQYGAAPAASTGQVPSVTSGATNQLVSGFQVIIPGAAAATASWNADDIMSFALPAGVTFAAAPIVTITSKPVLTADLLKVADPADATVLAGTTALASTDLPTRAVNSTNKNVLEVTFPTEDPNKAVDTSSNSYVLSVSNVRVNVTSDFDYSASSPLGAVKVTPLKADGTAVTADATTIGYVNAFSVTASGSYPANATTVKLPAISVTELSVNSFPAAAAAFTLTVSADAATGQTVGFAAGTASATASNSVTLPGAAKADGSHDVTVAAGTTVAVTGIATSKSALERVTLSGLEVTGVKAGAEVTLTLTTPANLAGNGAASSFTAAQAVSAKPSAKVAAEVVVPRIGGADRYATAADIAAQFAKTAAFSKNAVVLANGTTAKDGADALSANYLAFAKGAPILLTDGTTLASSTKDALTALFKGSQTSVTIYVMGKNDSVSQAVVDAAKAAVTATVDTATVTTQRVAGDNRYDTAAASATIAGLSALGAYNLGNGLGYTAFLASGQVNADALAAGAISAKAGVPVLLTTDGEELPASAAKFIKDADVTNVVILGATDRVSQKVEDTLKESGVNVTRVAGTDRYDTAVEVNKLAYKNFTSALTLANATVYLANGMSGAQSGFADALAVGPLAGANQNPLLTVPLNSLPDTTEKWLLSNSDDIDGVVALGKSDRISDDVITAAQKAIL